MAYAPLPAKGINWWTGRAFFDLSPTPRTRGWTRSIEGLAVAAPEWKPSLGDRILRRVPRCFKRAAEAGYKM
jgi:hypothetical protein